jgi:hypothetical protein
VLTWMRGILNWPQLEIREEPVADPPLVVLDRQGEVTAKVDLSGDVQIADLEPDRLFAGDGTPQSSGAISACWRTTAMTALSRASAAGHR